MTAKRSVQVFWHGVLIKHRQIRLGPSQARRLNKEWAVGNVECWELRPADPLLRYALAMQMCKEPSPLPIRHP